jgi:hypothetical protein
MRSEKNHPADGDVNHKYIVVEVRKENARSREE